MYSVFRKLAWLVVFATAVSSVWGASRADHVLVISIDGGKPAVIAQSGMPVLKRLVAEGACTWTARTIFPSITLPSHVSMLTGVGPAKHQILWNVWKPVAGVVKVPTIFSEASKAGLLTAMFVGKEKFRHLDLPGSLDRFDFLSESQQVINPPAENDQPKKSKTVLAKTVAQNAAEYFRQKQPNLCFLHFTDPDDAGHKYGWGSPEQISAFENVDQALGIVLNALDEAKMTSRTVVIITADHGGHNKTHGLDIPDDMEIPWIAWGTGVKRKFTITKPVVTVDTAVTALWLLDVRPLDSFDGQVVDSAFEVKNN